MSIKIMGIVLLFEVTKLGFFPAKNASKHKENQDRLIEAMGKKTSTKPPAHPLEFFFFFYKIISNFKDF